MKIINEFGDKEEIPTMEFESIPNAELRLRNTANTALNYWADHGEEAAHVYILRNVSKEDEPNFRKVFVEVAKKRGMWNGH